MINVQAITAQAVKYASQKVPVWICWVAEGTKAAWEADSTKVHLYNNFDQL